MANYLIYPFKVMRITQSYNGSTSHAPHNTGNPKDWPLDEGGADGGREGFYCPCDEMEIVRIYGVGNGGTNTIWLQSTSKVDFADGTSDVATIQITHPNDSDLKKIKKGQKFKRKELVCFEGADGATGNHIHQSVGKGAFKGTGWLKNSKGKYVINTTHGGVKPENAFVIDESFTKRVIDTKGIKFKTLSQIKKDKETAAEKGAKTGTFKVTADRLNVRREPGLSGVIVTSFVKGAKITVTETKTVKEKGKKTSCEWGKCSRGWVALKYCKKV